VAVKLRGLLPPSDLPTARARIPAVAVRAVFVIAGVLLSLVDYRLTDWLAVGIALSVWAASSPQSLLGWVLILFLAAGQLGRHAGLDWRLLVLVAGLQLLHVLAMLTLELPWRSWVQAGVFVGPLLRFLTIQVIAQPLAVIVLLVLAPNGHGHRPLSVPEFALIGAAAFAGLALLLLRPWLDEAPRPPAA
jgi:hypothetical protein